MGFSSSILDVVFHGESPFDDEPQDVKHEEPLDRTLEQVWFKEPAHSGVLTKDGVENIARHKYTPGQTTYFDDFCNPIWTGLAEKLPMSLAPNLVTTVGFSFLLLAYGITWYHTERLDMWIPSWVIAFNGLCTIVYYTLDCMDGKQARRTGTSSPLGQLFDHGVDCLGNITHISSASAYIMMGGTPWYFLAQVCLQFSFFMAQWEEYYTHVLPHAQGKWIGVTEVNYGMGLISILNAFIDREKVWESQVSTVVPDSMATYLPDWILALEISYLSIFMWATLCTVMVILCIIRVLTYVKEPKVMASAICQLVSPFLLGLCPFLLPSDVLYDSARYLGLSMGLAYCLITTKLIFLSMAKMPYAVFQGDIYPMVALCLWVRFDQRLTMLGAKTLFMVCCVWYLFRFSEWAAIACNQICARLDIYIFRIKDKKKD